MDKSKEKICKKTIGTDYPHHWDCKYVDQGHPGCTCNDTEDYLRCKECTIRNPGSGSDKRFPDGSIVRRKSLEKGNVHCGVHPFSGKSRIIPMETIKE